MTRSCRCFLLRESALGRWAVGPSKYREVQRNAESSQEQHGRVTHRFNSARGSSGAFAAGAGARTNARRRFHVQLDDPFARRQVQAPKEGPNNAHTFARCSDLPQPRGSRTGRLRSGASRIHKRLQSARCLTGRPLAGSEVRAFAFCPCPLALSCKQACQPTTDRLFASGAWSSLPQPARSTVAERRQRDVHEAKRQCMSAAPTFTVQIRPTHTEHPTRPSRESRN